eukprot:scaffold514541_cov19-Prasinocladus_malaysianus.AAC.1
MHSTAQHSRAEQHMPACCPGKLSKVIQYVYAWTYHFKIRLFNASYTSVQIGKWDTYTISRSLQ